MNIFPTGKCFDDAMDFFSYGFPRDRNRNVYLCHGLMQGIYSHAWVNDQNTDTCFDFGFRDGEKICFEMPSCDYYVRKKPMCITYYNERQVFYYNHRYGTFGPWDILYLRHCKDGKGVLIKKVYDEDFRLSSNFKILCEMGLGEVVQ